MFEAFVLVLLSLLCAYGVIPTLYNKEATAQQQGSRLDAAARYEALGLCAAFCLFVLCLVI